MTTFTRNKLMQMMGRRYARPETPESEPSAYSDEVLYAGWVGAPGSDVAWEPEDNPGQGDDGQRRWTDE